MWSKLWTWADANKLLALIIVVISFVAITSALDGVSMRQTAKGYLDLARGWAAAYQRDTAATKAVYEARIKVLTAERDALRKRYAAAKGRIDGPWRPPAGNSELEARYRAMGYQGRVK